MKFMGRFKYTLRTIGVFVIVFSLYHFAIAQETSEVISEELNSAEEINQNNPDAEVLGEVTVNDVDLIQEVTQENLEDVLSPVSEIVETEVEETIEIVEQEPTLFEKILDIFIDTPEEQIIEEQLITEEFLVEEEYFEDPAPFVFPQSLPEISAIPEILEFETDVDAPHACWVEDFSVDMQFLPNKNNTLVVNNPTTGPSTLEITGVPPGFNIFFKENKSQLLSIPSSQQEIPFTIEKNGETQDGSFNIIFVFTKKTGRESVTTCQMNLTN